MILQWILSFLGGNIIERLTAAYAKSKDSAVESEKVRADVLKKQLDTQLEAHRLAQQVRIATAGFWEARVLAFLIAAPFVLHLWLVALDTCFSFGWRIPAFPKPFDEWEGAIILSFFGVQIAGKVSTSIVGAVIARR